MSAPCPILGFSVRATLRDSSPDARVRALHDSLIAVLEAEGLYATGGGDRTLEWFVAREGSQATEADREFVEAWAAQWRGLVDITISDLIDLDRDA